MDLKTIVTLAGNLGMEVVAEGVESDDQLHQLKRLKCHYAQGCLFSRPLDSRSIYGAGRGDEYNHQWVALN